MDKIIVEVTETHIKNAQHSDVERWAIALALLECSEIKECSIDFKFSLIKTKGQKIYTQFSNDEYLNKWQRLAIELNKNINELSPEWKKSLENKKIEPISIQIDFTHKTMGLYDG